MKSNLSEEIPEIILGIKGEKKDPLFFELTSYCHFKDKRCSKVEGKTSVTAFSMCNILHQFIYLPVIYNALLLDIYVLMVYKISSMKKKSIHC